MPQLSTAHIFLIHLWTWFVLYLITQKIKTVLMNKTPTNAPPMKPNKPTPTLPWT
uniref:ATP synthase F0 subunit 8 n=1 Tax=Ophiophagus hannah TaxID=8665 RepID=B6DCH1_OPHHA|nr:ATP synthase F0 subunit 8 [Ophiophagus hannah]ACF94340.1 ATP synthase F0 subunit 8 [Ophiophagus hannah]